MEPVSPPEYHHVSLAVSKVSEMPLERNPQQNIKAVVHVKMSKEQAEGLLEILRSHIIAYQAGMDPVTFSLEGEFT